MKKKLSVGFILACFAAVLFAAEEPSGLEIMQKVYDRPTGNDMEAELVMTLVNSRGDSRERAIQQFRMNEDGVEKKIMFFLAPADVRNTSFMSWSYDEAGREDDQWIYLPALKRVKRISGAGKSDSFMGSDFTYDDLGERHPSEDTHRLLRTETLDGEMTYVVESIPKDEDSLYSRTISWVVKDTWIGLKKEFYDEDGELLKVLTIQEYENSNGIWVLTDFVMDNVQKDHRTEMRLNDVVINGGIRDDMFTERMMKRGLR